VLGKATMFNRSSGDNSLAKAEPEPTMHNYYSRQLHTAGIADNWQLLAAMAAEPGSGLPTAVAHRCHSDRETLPLPVPGKLVAPNPLTAKQTDLQRQLVI